MSNRSIERQSNTRLRLLSAAPHLKRNDAQPHLETSYGKEIQ